MISFLDFSLYLSYNIHWREVIKIAEWLTLIWEIATTLTSKGILDKDKLPKDFPKTKEELENFIIKTTKNNIDEIFSDTYEVVGTFED